MKILVMRHGEAEHYAAGGDAARRLTQRGQQQVFAAGRCLQNLGFAPEQIWVSPYLRAQQTADGVQESLTVPARLTSELLTPDADISALVADITAISCSSVMLVSHQPLVSYLLARLSGEDTYRVPALTPASMVLLEAEEPLPGCFDILWEKHAPDFGER